MNSPTNTNQASEDKLTYGVDRGIPGGDFTALSIKKGSTLFTFTGDEAVAIIDVIRTEKLKLLDEVREQAEEYELNMHGFYDKDVSDQITAVPLEALAKLEAEL